jgi:hypothetical protein
MGMLSVLASIFPAEGTEFTVGVRCRFRDEAIAIRSPRLIRVADEEDCRIG